MHGKPTLNKKLSKMKRDASKANATRPSTSVQIGNWRLSENEDGDLIIKHQDTGKIIILARN